MTGPRSRARAPERVEPQISLVRTLGTTGVFAPERVLFATLSTTGLRLIPVDLRP